MKLLPFEKITIRTELPVDELGNRLNALIEPKKAGRFDVFASRSTKPYEGELTGDQFRISRIIDYRNSFLPQISGIIQPDGNGSIIQVTMQLHPFVLIFLLVWCTFVSFGCLAVLPVMLNNEFSLALLIPFGMLLFMYGLTMIAFWVESKQAKRDLQQVFGGKIVDA